MSSHFDEANQATLKHYDEFLKPDNLSKYRWDRPEIISAKLQFRRLLLQALVKAQLTEPEHWRVLDVGCGSGAHLSSFLELGVRPEGLVGIDINPARVEEARRLLPQAHLQVVAGDSIPEADASFDVVLAFVVFSSMPTQALRQRMAEEMRRVVKPGGVVLLHDFVAARPGGQHVSAVPTKEVRALFPGCEVRTRRTVLPPPLARLTARLCPGFLPWMELALPWLSLHRLHAIRAPHLRAQARPLS